jgi:hypothetical protein
MLAELGPSKLRTLCHAEYNINWIMEGLVINRPSGTLPLYLCLSDFSQELKKTVVQMGSYSDLRKYSHPWHFSYFFTYNLELKYHFLWVCIIWFTQHAYHFEDAKYFCIVKQTRNKTKKRKTWACITIHPPKSVICRATFCSNYSCKSLGVCLHKLGTSSHCDFCPFFKAKLLQLLQVVGFRWCTAIFNSYHRFSIWLRSGLWLGHSITSKCSP